MSVLILEDDADLALIAKATLNNAGIEVRVVDSVEGALAACEEAAPRVAVVDLQLLGRSGWDFVRAVREDGRWPDVRFAIYTVHGDEPETIQAARDLGVDLFLPKSGDPEELVEAVRLLLAKDRE